MKAVIWTKQNCPFCEEAKSILKNLNCEIEEKVIGSPFLLEDLLEVIPTAKSVPQIFLDDEYIGGCDDLKALFGV